MDRVIPDYAINRRPEKYNKNRAVKKRFGFGPKSLTIRPRNASRSDGASSPTKSLKFGRASASNLNIHSPYSGTLTIKDFLKAEAP